MKKILGIESSCDDTAISIITERRKILSNIIISQNTEHAVFGGVVPEIAARSHLSNLDQALKNVLKKSNTELTEISAIAATSGPGLIGGVIVGSMFARSLSSALKKPFIAINHLEGHALTARLTDNISYPYLLLLASGGHCQFVAVLGLGKYKILGTTIDDAVGETFDKVAKMLNLSFPGGPEIEKRAKLGNPHKYKFPKPIINSGNCNMSFSGLKTAVRTLIMNLKEVNDSVINDIAASFQFTIGAILSSKMQDAIRLYKQILNDYYEDINHPTKLNLKSFRKDEFNWKPLECITRPKYRIHIQNSYRSNLLNDTIVIAGGVAANKYLQEILSDCTRPYGYRLIAPPMHLCTDNAAMIAYAGLERYNNKLFSPLDFCPKAKWSLEDI
ncbi:tRNA (adenosine(37)-N6)-threonylcarbamoyltransferase complex transferase subunit TsaD [Rickettsia prowazekii]|uniref:tRNA N6-adenosine threonylcarbamoyltransferase n=2 Tax=Rickettsia prowazekii TaxID=782 RepID=TSAD_RICPR|nr:tRNA (adenosine(37)-N6)-threonylcarbamoyltransferase complex transferase subunit TsaD [Rickettsia prowazekii]Q9ZEA8.1 RecName: Full=tRNA N6-adenosine threonylcarbamoyltransferase; AltName: Full=N6-L-threonylcarbamoyladenine synthase; Short=t(6)A synthase; AltName: Full=t(6)A37 threonylcarbamoyladenosine biosynthesis protein TsaD; AltName: Full=tRNA threonylcarbamoyladenosine biosynthesis protein TsaD [Rickettsia prowazekii str. Madrid E]EOB10142.1 Acyl-CoA desaturase 1 [Rickettsia prowazekii s